MTKNKKIQKIIAEVVEKIKTEYQPEKIILYGSYAYGTPTEDSDIDLLIIKDTDKSSTDRFCEVTHLIDGLHTGISVQPNIYTPEQIRKRLSIGDHFVEDVLVLGDVLYSRDTVAPRQLVAAAKVERLKKGWLFDVSPEYIKEWGDKGNRYLLSARRLLEGKGPSEVVAVLLQQASEMYLKAYLLPRGWRLKKIHDLRELLKQAVEYDSSFGEFAGLAERLTKLYIEQRYPTEEPPANLDEEVVGLLAQTKKLVAKIQDSPNPGTRPEC